VTALQVGLLVLSRRDRLLQTILAALAAALCLLLILLAPLVLITGAGGGGQVPHGSGIPRRFVPFYTEAARVFQVNWLVLAALHKTETGFSTHPTTYDGVNSAGCCAGPMQFSIVGGGGGTWGAYRNAYRHGRRPSTGAAEHRPHPSVYDDFDAIMAAAAYLHALGAGAALDDRMLQALAHYKGTPPYSYTYARETLAIARRWQAARAEPIRGSAGPLSWPVQGPVTSPFGMRWGRLHAGIDIAAPIGTPIRAAATGRVTTRGWVSGYGNYSCLEHLRHYSTCYAHQSRLGPTPIGQLIGRGQLVGYTGCTGHCLGPHLHFELHVRGRPVDPAPYLRGRP
jgi:hypothetical protein